MPNALTTASTLTCPHGGTIVAIPAQTRLSFGGAPALGAGDAFQIVGCAFALPSGTPSPCLSVEWVSTDLRTSLGGAATLSDASVGLCKAATGAPQGTVIVAATQTQGQTT